MRFVIFAIGTSLSGGDLKGCIGEYTTRREAENQINRVSSEIMFNSRPNGLCLRSYSAGPESLPFYLGPDIVANLVWQFEVVEIE